MMIVADPEAVLAKIEAALPVAESMSDCPPEILEALRITKLVLRQTEERRSPAPGENAILWTVEDDGCAPDCREIEMLLHYEWEDYSAGDSITPSSGGCARIVDVEVVAVRYFDDCGEVTTLEQHHLRAAWEAVEKKRELLEELCTDAGHRAEVGRTSPLYFPGPSQPRPADSEAQSWKMAPSGRARSETEQKRKQG